MNNQQLFTAVADYMLTTVFNREPCPPTVVIYALPPDERRHAFVGKRWTHIKNVDMAHSLQGVSDDLLVELNNTQLNFPPEGWRNRLAGIAARRNLEMTDE